VRWNDLLRVAATHRSIEPAIGRISRSDRRAQTRPESRRAIRQNLYAEYRFHDDMLEKGFPFAQQHFENVSKTVGWPLPIPESVINHLRHRRGRSCRFLLSGSQVAQN
jgi:hypothetical protein